MNKLIICQLIFPVCWSLLFLFNKREDDTTFLKYLGNFILLSLIIFITYLSKDRKVTELILWSITIPISINFYDLLSIMFSYIIFFYMLTIPPTKDLPKSFYFFAYLLLAIISWPLIIDMGLVHMLFLLFLKGILIYICILLYFSEQMSHSFKYFMAFFILITLYLFMADSWFSDLMITDQTTLLDIDQIIPSNIPKVFDNNFLSIMFLISPLLLGYLILKITLIRTVNSTCYTLPFFASLVLLAIFSSLVKFIYPLTSEYLTNNKIEVLYVLIILIIFSLIRMFQKTLTLKGKINHLWGVFNILVIISIFTSENIPAYFPYLLLITQLIYFPLFIYWIEHLNHEKTTYLTEYLSKFNHFLFFIIGSLLPFSALFIYTYYIIVEMLRLNFMLIFFALFFYFVIFLFYRKLLIFHFNHYSQLHYAKCLSITLVLLTITGGGFYYLWKIL